MVSNIPRTILPSTCTATRLPRPAARASQRAEGFGQASLDADLHLGHQLVQWAVAGHPLQLGALIVGLLVEVSTLWPSRKRSRPR